MPMYQALAIFLGVVLFSAVCAAFVERLRTDLFGPMFWGLLLATSAVISFASAWREKTRHSGTGLTTEYGWPKPFHFRYASEAGALNYDWEPIYFVGNSLIFAAGLLVLWTLSRLIRR